VFERFTEKARRVIFFARYHASEFGTPHIETEHLLLGLFREDEALARRAAPASPEQLRQRIGAVSPARERISTSVDLPLSQDARRVLALAAEESSALGHEVIDTGHLVLGLLRIPCLATAYLQEHGVEYAGYREIVASSYPGAPEPAQMPEAAPPQPQAPSLAAPVAALITQIALAAENLETRSGYYGEQRLKRKPWTRKQAMGHLVDLATAHHQWLARALTEPKLTAAVYPNEAWVTALEYQSYSWKELVDLWVALNRLLLHVLVTVPEAKLSLTCKIGIEEPQTLLALIHRYVGECEDLIGQMLAKL
jgi:ClpA/ClpB-like protein